MKKISLISLGCPKNLVDSENILALLGEKKYVLTDVSEADLVILNTCAFIKPAVEETKEYIKKLISEKKKLLVVGCFVQRYKEKLKKYSGISGFVGVGNPKKVISAVEDIFNNKRPVIISQNFTHKKNFPRFILTYPYAYIKISEGCNNFCSYCLIPFLRGNLRSRKEKDIIDEAISLQKIGIKELILISQDTTSYGRDLKDGSTFTSLLKKLTKLQFSWIRILYTYPSHIDHSLIEVIRKNKKICSYLDVPIQHAHPEILKKMGRPIMDYEKFFEELRKKIPDIHLRTTFIVGFPGEDESSFNELLRFLSKYKFDRAGFFKYSREKFTPAYGMLNQIDSKTKNERLKLAYQLQKRISDNIRKSFIGKKMDVIIEEISEDGYAFGRTERDAPEIDEGVIIKGNSELLKDKLGEIVKVKMIASKDYNLIGEIV